MKTWVVIWCIYNLCEFSCMQKHCSVVGPWMGGLKVVQECAGYQPVKSLQGPASNLRCFNYPQCYALYTRDCNLRSCRCCSELHLQTVVVKVSVNISTHLPVATLKNALAQVTSNSTTLHLECSSWWGALGQLSQNIQDHTRFDRGLVRVERVLNALPPLIFDLDLSNLENLAQV